MSVIKLPKQLTLDDFIQLSTRKKQLGAATGLPVTLNNTHQYLMDKLADGAQIYGVNTGFGPLVDRTVNRDDMSELQENLLQQLSCNTGPEVPPAVARGTMILRANAISKGHSAARFELFQQLIQFINSGATPVIQAYGSVGASGDLIPLTRMARTLLGMEKVRLPDGKIEEPSAKLLRQVGIKPLDLKPKEGLALVNGTSYSCATAALCLSTASRILYEYAMPLSSTLLLVMNDSLQHLSEDVYRVKPHESARKVCADFNTWLKPLQPEQSHGLPQPPYSARSLVLWLGAIRDHLESAEKIVETELNSVDDNPLFFPEFDRILHAANFQGSYVAKAADDIAAGSAKIAGLMERQLNRLFHDKLNGDLPAFLAPEPVGLHSGMQGFQLLATSLLADIKSKSVYHGAQSISTNADNQDIVSMSANAALNAMEVVRKTSIIAALLECGLARALQLRTLTLTPKLERWWQQRPSLLNTDFSGSDLAPVLEQRKKNLLNWDV